MNKYVDFVKNLLGEDFFEIILKDNLKKTMPGGFLKLTTNTALDPEEIKIALQIVPRAVLTYLIEKLKYEDGNEVINVDFTDLLHHDTAVRGLPVLQAIGARMVITKHSPDNYSGTIYQNNKIAYQFKNRSIPGIGLLLLTTFELYDSEMIDEIKTNLKQPDIKETPTPVGPTNYLPMDVIQDKIEERLRLQMLVSDVVDHKLTQRDAVTQLINSKLTEMLRLHAMQRMEPMATIPEHEHITPNDLAEKSESSVVKPHKKLKIQQFLAKCNSKKMNKSEGKIRCPDCGHSLYNGGDKINLCICYGEYMNQDICISKSESGKIKLDTPKEFGIDNLHMLLDAIKNK